MRKSQQLLPWEDLHLEMSKTIMSEEGKELGLNDAIVSKEELLTVARHWDLDIAKRHKAVNHGSRLSSGRIKGGLCCWRIFWSFGRNRNYIKQLFYQTLRKVLIISFLLGVRYPRSLMRQILDLNQSI
ncbi:hypothetical protein MKW98_011920 [Papaver atlanticum]|uniref:Uncharacterized protein n=1 Tax=Papaver atlanticum TaxID=357466 RepID=A0AAD4T376_9MAGN|nr:hypothetical protein MKW98_011920 [Papaver atlanticum]